MNGDSNVCPSGRVLEFCYDSSSNNDLRLEDRQFTWVITPSLAAGPAILEEDEEIIVYEMSTRKNKPLPLKPGFTEFYIDASLPVLSKLSQETPVRSENRRSTDCDIVEIPVTATQHEIDEIIMKRQRSRRPERGQANNKKEEVINSIRIGERYQAVVRSRLEDEEQTPTVSDTDQIWDPQRAAQIPTLDLERYLNQSQELSIKMLLLEALHSVNYDLEKATRMFYQIHAQRQDLSVTFSEAERGTFASLCRGSVIGKRKDFREAARIMTRPVESILVQYYRWKAGNRPTYNALKKKRRRDPDECCHCKDGGLLIVCNSCCRAFHLECLQPQLAKVPEGDWFCSLCTQHSPRLRRSPTQKTGNITSTRLDFDGQSHSAKSTNGRNKPHLDSRLQQLKSVHKELTFLSRKPSPASSLDVTPATRSPSAKAQPEDSPFSVQLYGNLHSDDDDNEASPLGDAEDSTTNEDPDSDYESGEDEIDGGFSKANVAASNKRRKAGVEDSVTRATVSIDADVVETPSKKHKTEVSDIVPNASVSVDVLLPICPGGFRLVIRLTADNSVVVVDYAAEKGYAEACSLIYPGDVITHVDGEPCARDIHTTLELLRSPSDFGVKVIRITRSVERPLPPIGLPRSYATQKDNPRCLAFLLPVLPEGFSLNVAQFTGTYGVVCKIGSYKRRNGQKGFAELYNLFRPGDEIVAIDGFNCLGATLQYVLTIFKSKSSTGWRTIMIRRWRESAGDALRVIESNDQVDATSNERKSSVVGSISEQSATNISSTNGDKNRLPEDIGHSSTRISSLPSAGPPNSTGGSGCPGSYPTHNSTQISNLLAQQSYNSFVQQQPLFQNGAGINASLQPNFFSHMTYQSLQPNPANNFAPHFQPARGLPFGDSTGNGPSR